MTLTSWLPVPADSDFSIYNLPFGIFSTRHHSKRVGIAIGDYIVDLAAAGRSGAFRDLHVGSRVFQQPVLNPFIALGKPITQAIRLRVQQWLTQTPSLLQEHNRWLVPMQDATLHLPVHIGDYTDFYAGEVHASNVGKMFRNAEQPLLPNWKHLPVGYHGRSSSVVLSGTPVHRPWGQILPAAGGSPVFHPSAKLDFELEVALVVGKENTLGKPVSITEAKDYIFGLVLLNDWSARDIQRWEYQPLGPFLGKNFATSISPWIIPLEALEPFTLAGPEQSPPVLPYLQCEGAHHLDMDLEVDLNAGDGVATICRANMKYLYWNMPQMIAHHTINGCNLRIGDLLGSGTISAPAPNGYGSMLELSWDGKHPLVLPGGQERSWLADGDEVTMRGYGIRGKVRVGFGAVTGKILPASPV